MKTLKYVAGLAVMGTLIGCQTAPRGDIEMAGKANKSLATEIDALKNHPNAKYNYVRRTTAEGEQIQGHIEYTDKNLGTVRKTFSTDEKGVFSMTETVQKGYNTPFKQNGPLAKKTVGIKVEKSALTDGIYAGTLIRESENSRKIIATDVQSVEVVPFAMGYDLNKFVKKEAYTSNTVYAVSDDYKLSVIKPVKGTVYANLGRKEPTFFVLSGKDLVSVPYSLGTVADSNEAKAFEKNGMLFITPALQDKLTSKSFVGRQVIYRDKNRRRIRDIRKLSREKTK